MKKMLVLSLIAFLSQTFSLSAQDKLSNGRALNIPFKKYGISFGNSHEFNGIRINFADKDVKRINGLNITFWINNYYAWEHKAQNYSSSVNGISIGVLPTCGSMQHINLGLFRVAAEKKINGLSFSGLNIRSNGNINGVCISGLATKSESTLSGFAFSGFGIGGIKGINGVAGSFIALYCGGKFNGIGITGIYLATNKFNGIAIAGYSNTKQMNGLSVAILNRTEELHGVQIGLWNYAENNRKGFKRLPLINFHLKRKQQTD